MEKGNNNEEEPDLLVEIECEEAKKYKDLISIYQDFDLTLTTLKRLKESIENKNEDRVLHISYWTTALISYSRSFASGKRFGLSEEIFEGLDGAIDCHRFYKNIRDKHIAHSVNPFEEVYVALRLSNCKREIVETVEFSKKFDHIGIEGLENFIRLVIVIKNKLVVLLEEKKKQFLEKGKSLPIEKLHAKPCLKTVIGGPEDAAKPRKA